MVKDIVSRVWAYGRWCYLDGNTASMGGNNTIRFFSSYRNGRYVSLFDMSNDRRLIGIMDILPYIRGTCFIVWWKCIPKVYFMIGRLIR